MVTRILFVCMGNICRSPMAEGILRARAAELGRTFGIDSAGTSGYHAGEAPDPRAVRTALQFGIDISHLRARRFLAEDCDLFDHIVAMDRDNLGAIERIHAASGGRARLSLLLDHAADIRLDEVPDPYYGGEEGFVRCFKLIRSGVDGLLERLAAEGRRA